MQIENMITKGYKVLIICPVDATALGNVLEKTKAAGIPVISYDRLIKNTKNVDYYLTFDNIHVGEVCGKYIVDKLGLDRGKGPFNLEIFTGDIADNNAKMTLQGGMNILKKYIDNKQLVVRSGQTALEQVATPHWGGAEAEARMDNIMGAFYTNAHLDCILSTYGGMSLGCIASLKALGYGNPGKPMPLITAQDAEKAITIAVAKGDLSMTIFKDTRVLAQNAIDIAVHAIKGEKVMLDESKFYDNGAFMVPTFLSGVTPFDKSTLDKTVIATGYWTHADIYGK
jgi:putative multiple sugar transport system substrate-binding protein